MSVVNPQQRFESQRTTVEAKLNTGQPLDIFDAIFLSKYYPGVVKQLNPTPAPPLTPHERYEESMGRSYPSFEPQSPKQIVWPTETVTVGKSPTSAGRQVTIQRKPITESGPTLTGWLLERSEQAKLAEQYLPSGVRTSKGLEAAAGLAYTGESLVNPLTPFKLSGPFIGGMFVGIVGESYVVGKIVEPITKPYTEWLQAKGSSYLTKQYETAVEEGRPLSWKGPKERLVEIITHGRVESPRGPQIVDVPNASAVTEGRATVSREFLEKPMPSNYLAQVGGPEVEAPLTHGLGSSLDFSQVGGPEVSNPLTHNLPRPEGMESLAGFKKVYSAPDILVKLTDTDFRLPPMRALEAESGAMSFGTTARTALLDPELVSPLENVVTRQIFSLPSALPMLSEEVRTASFLPTFLLSAAIFGVEAKQSQRGVSVPIVSPLTRNLPKLDFGLDLKTDVATGLELSPLMALSSLTAQSSMTEQVAKTVQMQTPKQLLRTLNAMPPEVVQLQTPRFFRQDSFDFKRDFLKQERMKKGGWEKRYMWEFPVKGAKEMLKAL